MESCVYMNIMKQIAIEGIIPTVTIDNVADAVPVAQAISDGGINVIEITFRTAAAPEAINAISTNCPNMLVGAGTIITLDK